MGQAIDNLILNLPFGAENIFIFRIIFIALFVVLACYLLGIILGLCSLFWDRVILTSIKYLLSFPSRIVRAIGLWARKCLYKQPLTNSKVVDIPVSSAMDSQVHQELLQEQQKEEQPKPARKEYLLDESLMEKLITFEHSRSPKMRH